MCQDGPVSYGDERSLFAVMNNTQGSDASYHV